MDYLNEYNKWLEKTNEAEQLKAMSDAEKQDADCVALWDLVQTE